MKDKELAADLKEIEGALANLSDEQIVGTMLADSQALFEEVGFTSFWQHLPEWAKRCWEKNLKALYPARVLNSKIGQRGAGQLTGRLDASVANLVGLQKCLERLLVSVEEKQAKLRKELRWNRKGLNSPSRTYHESLADPGILFLIRFLELLRRFAERCANLVISEAQGYSQKLSSAERLEFFGGWSDGKPLLDSRGQPVVASNETKPFVVRTTLMVLGVVKVIQEEIANELPQEFGRLALPENAKDLQRIVVGMDWTGEFSRNPKSDEWDKDLECVGATCRSVRYPFKPGRPKKH